MRFLTLLFIIFCASCAPKTHYITEAQLREPTPFSSEPFDTLTAYRKAPGQPKTVHVQGYYRKDSTYVAGHKRSARNINQ